MSKNPLPGDTDANAIRIFIAAREDYVEIFIKPSTHWQPSRANIGIVADLLANISTALTALPASADAALGDDGAGEVADHEVPAPPEPEGTAADRRSPRSAGGTRTSRADDGQQRVDAPPKTVSQALTRREVEVLSHIAAGATNKSIAKKMAVSNETVRAHVKSIFRKTGLSNRTQAAVWAVDQKLIEAIAAPRERKRRNSKAS